MSKSLMSNFECLKNSRDFYITLSEMHSGLLESNTETENKHIEDIEIDENNACGDKSEIFESEDVMKKSLTHICYGDLYIIGRIWIEALKTVLIGTKLTLIPVVSAAAKPEFPQKPPLMKYTDLPLYKSPHYEYKDYVEDKKKCPKARVKILHQYLLPKVKYYRKEFEKASCEVKCAILNAHCNLSNSITDSKKDFKEMMRDPNNLPLRQGVLLFGGAAGYLLAYSKGIPRRLFYTGLGLLSTGALCFPKETDAAFRDFASHSGKMLLAFYNGLLQKQGTLREGMPCKEDLPPPPCIRKPQCLPKKK